ncbi:uncharacterized protein FOMMEDRAFT_170628 [Fomitiporia mediterranea MF3/22]|uniref:uncharacterized protein n=1 Tax=Fomitiporia mediterranea (strain MF3/22) TaxID=694068 RepID=UPI0004407FD7|nr:uncharacterized protein FOMMEDRAFT_170628 [Fomitiporia mediterranea MF3/22]EJC99338.1 hypothetical protein FOMMEDRAFT_170628 [Fomitiporia mediterranea MF3/22]
MPLFGNKHNDDNVAYNAEQPNAGYDNTAGYDNPGMTGSGGNRLRKNHGAAHNDPLYPSSNAPGAGYGQQERGMAGAGGYNDNITTNHPHMREDGYEQTGYGSGGAARHAMPPQTDAMGNPTHPRTGGGGSRLAGKVESAVGTMLGSENLKRKGMEKEQESQALKVQASELSEAERLEQAALARRERAVAHGAHPDHKHLGSHNPGAGAGNVNELGGGANTGVGGVGGAGSGARGGY